MYNDNFDELYEQYKPLIMSVIRGINVQGYDKEDILQELLMVLDDCNKSYDSSKATKFSTYLFISMRTKIHKLLRYQNRIKRAELVFMDDNDLDIIDETQSPEKSIDDVFIENELYNNIVNELMKMPYGEYTYMILVEGKTMQEVGDTVGVSKQRVSKVHNKNLAKLKELFK